MRELLHLQDSKPQFRRLKLVGHKNDDTDLAGVFTLADTSINFETLRPMAPRDGCYRTETPLREFILPRDEKFGVTSKSQNNANSASYVNSATG